MAIPPSPILPSRSRSVRCADERQALFNRIAPVYDNLLEFGAAPDMEKNGGIMERGQEGRQCVGFVLWKWGFGISTIRKSWV
ncbi:hypothetical protein CK203_018546 [Vitis vinifera]|uniref:Uncharacterized protein n=1 Tax=Vitis vinifera TaxID=29760 RepID=A0A438J634_VITVI|nr:hypothetical protein CK203_018546 [Vitis vinifera]